MSVPSIREFINQHSVSLTALAALGAALDARTSGTELDEPLRTRVADLLAALGGASLLSDVSAADAKPFVAELRALFALDAKLLRGPRSTGWKHGEPEILQDIGDTSAGFVNALARGVVPNLDGLAARFAAPGAAFLDVGTGVASLSIAVARQWPALDIVGLDVWQPSLALARANVARAGLDARIEIGEGRAEELSDEGRFDLAWFPTNFVPSEVVRPACERILRALRPGGWMLFIALGPDPKVAAVWRLRMAMHGNDAVPDAAGGEALLRDLGCVEVKTMPSPPGAFISVVAGRRAPG